jgi:hypothetical protein
VPACPDWGELVVFCISIDELKIPQPSVEELQLWDAKLLKNLTQGQKGTIFITQRAMLGQ